ncbi:hypothetical protein [Nonomuraea sp. NPDC002799]
MRKLVRNLLVAVPMTLALLLTAGAGAPASAATDPLTFDFADCDRIPSLIVCTVTFHGGVDPTTIRWYKDGVLKPQFNDKRLLRIGCTVGKNVTIEVVVTDATGEWFKFTTWGTCSRIAD